MGCYGGGIMYNPWESFDEDDESYNPMDDDMRFDDELVVDFARQRFQDLKKLLGQMVFNFDTQDWYQRFCEDKFINENHEVEFLEFSDEHIYDAAKECKSHSDYMAMFGFLHDEDDEVEYMKLLDVFGWFEKVLDKVETIDDMFEDIDG